MGYHVICTESYEIEGVICEKGDIKYYNSTQPLFSKKWRIATRQEVEISRNKTITTAKTRPLT